MSKHVATLNLFQEPDGTFEITVFAGTFDAEAKISGDVDLKPIDQIENRILAAAVRMNQRKRNDGTYRPL